MNTFNTYRKGTNMNSCRHILTTIAVGLVLSCRAGLGATPAAPAAARENLGRPDRPSERHRSALDLDGADGSNGGRNLGSLAGV